MIIRDNHEREAMNADNDTHLMRRAAETERRAERHWPADLLMQAADTIDLLRSLRDSSMRQGALEALEAIADEMEMMIGNSDSSPGNRSTDYRQGGLDVIHQIRARAARLWYRGLPPHRRPSWDRGDSALEALEAAADELAPLVDGQHPAALDPDQWLRARAARLREEQP